MFALVLMAGLLGGDCDRGLCRPVSSVLRPVSSVLSKVKHRERLVLRFRSKK